jgi:hypothetical protein
LHDITLIGRLFDRHFHASFVAGNAIKFNKI